MSNRGKLFCSSKKLKLNGGTLPPSPLSEKHGIDLRSPLPFAQEDRSWAPQHNPFNMAEACVASRSGTFGRNGREREREIKKKRKNIYGLPSPFFSGILLSRQPPETQGNGQVLKRTMVENHEI